MPLPSKYLRVFACRDKKRIHVEELLFPERSYKSVLHVDCNTCDFRRRNLMLIDPGWINSFRWPHIKGVRFNHNKIEGAPRKGHTYHFSRVPIKTSTSSDLPSAWTRFFLRNEELLTKAPAAEPCSPSESDAERLPRKSPSLQAHSETTSQVDSSEQS